LNSRTGFYSPAESGPAFSEKLLASIDAQLQKLRRASCPFINLPEKSRGRWGQDITPSVMNRRQWVKPVLVPEAKFTELTSDDQRRQPVFLGLRTDRKAKDVARE
jgi:bifunctional non-homologous end joining protein LigD